MVGVWEPGFLGSGPGSATEPLCLRFPIPGRGRSALGSSAVAPGQCFCSIRCQWQFLLWPSVECAQAGSRGPARGGSSETWWSLTRSFLPHSSASTQQHLKRVYASFALCMFVAATGAYINVVTHLLRVRAMLGGNVDPPRRDWMGLRGASPSPGLSAGKRALWVPVQGPNAFAAASSARSSH